MIAIAVALIVGLVIGWLACSVFGRVTAGSCRRGLVDLTGWSKGDTRR